MRNMRSDGLFALPPFCRVLPVPVLQMALIRLPPTLKRPRAVKYPANGRPLKLYPLKFSLLGVRGKIM